MLLLSSICLAVSLPDWVGVVNSDRCRQRIRVGVSPRGRGDTQGFCPLKIVDDVAVVQHAASEPSLCPQGDHAAEKRADDGRREQGLRFWMLTGWPRTTLIPLAGTGFSRDASSIGTYVRCCQEGVAEIFGMGEEWLAGAPDACPVYRCAERRGGSVPSPGRRFLRRRDCRASLAMTRDKALAMTV